MHLWTGRGNTFELPVYDLVEWGVSMTESEAKVILESEYKFHGECSVFGEALTIAINALEKQEKIKDLLDSCTAYPDDMCDCLVEIEKLLKEWWR